MVKQNMWEVSMKLARCSIGPCPTQQLTLRYLKNIRQPDSEADRQRFLAIILKARKIAQEKYHAPFLLLLWNAFLQENVRSNAEWLAQRLKENQLATLELSTVPGLENADSYIPVDFHPNGNGNTLLAHAVISFLAPYLRESSNAKLCSQEAH